jgi:hypothetical protein
MLTTQIEMNVRWPLWTQCEGAPALAAIMVPNMGVGLCASNTVWQNKLKWMLGDPIWNQCEGGPALATLLVPNLGLGLCASNTFWQNKLKWMLGDPIWNQCEGAMIPRQTICLKEVLLPQFRLCYPVVNCGYLWLPVVISGYLWLAVVSFGYLWFHVVTCG